MNWSNIVELLAAILPGPVAIGAVAWLGKVLITSRFEKDAAQFKNTLEATATAHKHTLDAQAAAHQHQLEQAAMVHRIRFESLHAKRAEKIVELYHEACLATWKTFEFVHPFQEGGSDYQAKCGRECVQLSNQFKRNVLLHRIYFPVELRDSLVGFATDLYSYSRRWQSEYDSAIRQNQNPYFGDTRDGSEFGKAYKKIETDFLRISEELEAEFRRLLGVGVSDESLVRTPDSTGSASKP